MKQTHAPPFVFTIIYSWLHNRAEKVGEKKRQTLLVKELQLFLWLRK